ncbi:MAG: nicotinate-nucleotide diphosphorylase [Desulfomonilaceae bacterium]
MVRPFGTPFDNTEHMDIRAYLFQPLVGASFVAEMTAAEPGLLAGTELARIRGDELEFQLESLASDGTPVSAGSRVLRLIGSAEEIAQGEEELLACVGKASGVATASARMVAKASGRARIVCGAWKKVAPELRKALRHAIAVGGAGIRLVDKPFVYLDKNFVRMFGSITNVVERARGIDGRTVAVQIRGDTDLITKEACAAFKAGAEVLMVDTGTMADLRSVVEVASREGFRERVKIAFAGGVTSSSLDQVIAAGADIVDVGRSVIDAPLLDFRFDVLEKV